MMNSSWHKIAFLGVLFVVIAVLNINPQVQEVEPFEDRSTNLVSAETARLLPQQIIGEDPRTEEDKIDEVSVSQGQATIPSSGGPLEEEVPVNEDGLAIRTTLALVTDIDTGERLYELNTSDRWPLASLSKVMTSVVATKLLDRNQIVTITDADFNPLDPSEFHALKRGESYTVEDLMRAMMVGSSNQAAEALARTAGREAFIAEMRTQATAWGMNDTYYGDPTGLSSTNQSTLDNLETFVGHVWREIPQIFEYSRTVNSVIVDPLTGQSTIIYAIHRLASRPEFRGGKTGYTDAAKENLISIFELNGRHIAIMVLGSEDRFGDTEELLDWTINRLAT